MSFLYCFTVCCHPAIGNRAVIHKQVCVCLHASACVCVCTRTRVYMYVLTNLWYFLDHIWWSYTSRWPSELGSFIHYYCGFGKHKLFGQYVQYVWSASDCVLIFFLCDYNIYNFLFFILSAWFLLHIQCFCVQFVLMSGLFFCGVVLSVYKNVKSCDSYLENQMHLI